jgi:hypothetical protein
MPRMLWTPKRPDWFRWSAAIAATCLLVYGVTVLWSPWAPGKLGGLISGTLAAGVFGIAGLYPLRRRLMGWPFRTAQRWLQFHIYGGTIASLLVLVHMGFRWPAGKFGWALFLLTVWTTVSGCIGVWLQKWIPMAIVNNLSVEVIAERIPELIGRLQAQADKVVQDASEMLERVYRSEVRPLLAGVNPSWSYLFDIRGSREQRMLPLQHVAQFLSEEERVRLADLQAIFAEKTELDAHATLQRTLRLWLVFHTPPSMLLLGLLAIHIASVLYL